MIKQKTKKRLAEFGATIVEDLTPNQVIVTDKDNIITNTMITAMKEEGYRFNSVGLDITRNEVEALFIKTH
jgi:hypothetical protein